MNTKIFRPMKGKKTPQTDIMFNHHYYRHNQRWQQGEFNIFLAHTRALLLSLLLFHFIGTTK